MDDSYEIDQQRIPELIDRIFQCTDSENAFMIFHKESLSELCFTAEFIRNTMIPRYEQDKIPGGEEFCRNVLGILELVLTGKIGGCEKLYTIAEETKDTPLVRNGRAYLLYTDHYRDMVNYRFIELPKQKPFLVLSEMTGTNRFWVTDWFHGMAEIEIQKKK